ncbi:MAG: sugar transferase [Calditrichaeota bacterium]|nr:sugar transferase [Calditrichota bacterium]
MSNLVLLITSFFSALAAVGGTRRIAIHFKIGALPSARKIHTDFKPLLGGLGIFVGIVIGFFTAIALDILPAEIWQEHRFFWAGLLAILITGFIDDLRGLNAWQKFSGEFLAAGLLVADGCFIQAFYSPGETLLELGWLGIPFSIAWIVFLMNAVNLLDGLDGLSSGISLIIASGFLLLAIAIGNVFLIVLAISLIGGILGFLRFNYHPASIFMGDVGSLMLGYLLAAFSIEGLKIANSHQVYFLASLVMLGMPVTDTLISFFRRMGRGDHPFKPDREHIHHRLLNLGLSHLDSVWMMYYFTLLYVALGVLMVIYREIAGIPLFILALAFSIYWAWRLGYVETRKYITFDEIDESLLAVRRPPIHVDKIWHQIAIFFGDIISINLAMYLTWWFRFQSGVVNPLTLRSIQDYLVAPVWLVFTAIWVILFWLNGLYQMSWDVSRFSKAMRVTKVVTFGVLMLLFLLNFDILFAESSTDIFNTMQLSTLAVYWASLIGFVNLMRLLIINIEKRLHIFEYTFKNTLVFGTNRKARNVIRDIRDNPHLLNHIVGVVDRKAKTDTLEGFPVVKEYHNLPQLIHEHRVEEIIVALHDSAKEDLLNIIAICDRMQIVVKTLPELQAVVSGRSGAIDDGPIVRAFPDNMMLWQWLIKRMIDFFAGIFAIVFLAIPGAILAFIGWRKFGRFPVGKIPIVGKQGRLFNMLLFHIDADDMLTDGYRGGGEKQLSAYGEWLYRTQIYKLPMLLNLLRGNVSLVGPRPEPLCWYREFSGKLRLLHRRLMVRPGITGLAQMKYRFESSQTDMRERLKYDIFYSENISLNLDLRILLRSLLILLGKLIG